MWVGMGSLAWRAEGLTRGLHEPKRVAQTKVLPGIEKAKEDGQVGPPGEQAKGEGASVQRNLGWDQHEALQEAAEVHVQDAQLVSLVLLSCA